MSNELTISVPFDVETLRTQFPALNDTSTVGKEIVYLDSAATAHKPLAVIESIAEFYSKYNSNVHRGVHTLSAMATAKYEQARIDVGAFIGAKSSSEIVFTKGTTESINLVAYTWGEQNIRAGDEVLLTEMEHHANIVPWQMLCQRKQAVVKFIPVLENGELDLERLDGLLNERTKLVSVTHVSNTLGTINDVEAICSAAKRYGAICFVDGAQAVMHKTIDVQALGCDFYAFSAHKLYGPTGVGVLYGRNEILQQMPPFMGGGAMIETVLFSGSTFTSSPGKFEAGTPNIAGVIGMAEAIKWFSSLDAVMLEEHEAQCTNQLLETLRSVDGVTVIGSAARRVGIASFVVDGVHAHDVGILLDEQGIAVRTGHHCTMPLLRRFGVQQTVRASLAAYSNAADIHQFRIALEKSIRMLR